MIKTKKILVLFNFVLFSTILVNDISVFIWSWPLIRIVQLAKKALAVLDTVSNEPKALSQNLSHLMSSSSFGPRGIPHIALYLTGAWLALTL